MNQNDQNQVNILLVDDRPENVLAMRSLLDSPNYRLIEAYSGEEALRCILKEDFALILLDVQMPVMNGFDTAKLIKAREKSKHIPIIFITALSQATQNVIQGYETGAIDFIFKPFHPTALRFKVDAFVNLYRYRDKLKEQNELISRRTMELEEANLRLTETAAELRRTEALARVIGETSADTILTLDKNGKIIAANPAVETMFGLKVEEAIGSGIERLLPDCSTIASGRKSDAGIMELTAVRRDGTSFPAEIQKGGAQIGDQSICVFSIRDISIRKQLEAEREQRLQQMEKLVSERTEELFRTNKRLLKEVQERERMAEQLQESHDRLSDILESITDGFFAVDQEWRLLYINRSAEKLLGIKQEEVLGHNMWDVLPQAPRLSSHLLTKAAREKTPVRYELFLLETNSWLEVRAFPSKQGMSVYLSDMSERKQMEEDIRHSQERFYKIFKASPSLIAIYSTLNGRYIDVNESWMSYTGYSYEEVINRTVDLQVTVEAPHLDGFFEAESVVRDVKVSYVTKSGERRTGLLSSEIIDIQGEPCMLTVITDITDRVKLEREMARLDRLHLIGEMAAGIAHEIRNPMTTVRGFLQMAKSSDRKPTSDIIDLMIDELNRANTIITEFLTLAKNKTTDRKKQSLNHIVEALFPLIQAEAMMSNKNVQLQLNKIPMLQLDEKEIRQMLLNLALNGLEAMTSGGSLFIRTYMSDCGKFVMLEVRDQGTGIQKDILDKLGTPFFTTKEQGTGLGLAVCYSIAARHNSKLEVQTGEQGTTFTVRFPIHRS
jgi:PAS domain S-box-containing protein